MTDGPKLSPELIANLQRLVEDEGASFFGLSVQNKDGHKYITVWAFPQGGQANTIGLNDLALKNSDYLYNAVGKVIVNLTEGSHPFHGEAPPPQRLPTNLRLITGDDNDTD